jgi:Flp pilus assembly protein TadG
MTHAATRNDHERGSATTELVLLTPVFIALLLFVVAVGRLSAAREDVDAAARDAARAASDARSTARASSDGQAAAHAAIREGDATCRRLTVTIDTSNFRAGGTVTARVSCVIDYADLTRLGVPGSRTIDSVFTAPVDQYRGVG